MRATRADWDRDLQALPQAGRWREWMLRVEAVLFASGAPVGREALARVVGPDCAIELLIEDIAASLHERPYEVVTVAGGWQMRTRTCHAAALRAARGDAARALRPDEALILAAVAYLQPLTRRALSRVLGRGVGRERLGRLIAEGLLARGPRSPEPGAPFTYVTTQAFLVHFGLQSLSDLPDIGALALDPEDWRDTPEALPEFD